MVGMDNRLKTELVASAVQAIGVPLVRAGINHRYSMKRLEREEEMAMKVAERRSRGLRAMSGGGGAGATHPQRAEPVALENPGDVYDELESLRADTDCTFCHNVIGSLMEASPGEAKQGYEELRSYVREVDRIKEQDISESEAEQIVGDLVERWETVPKYAAGMA